MCNNNSTHGDGAKQSLEKSQSCLGSNSINLKTSGNQNKTPCSFNNSQSTQKPQQIGIVNQKLALERSITRNLGGSKGCNSPYWFAKAPNNFVKTPKGYIQCSGRCPKSDVCKTTNNQEEAGPKLQACSASQNAKSTLSRNQSFTNGISNSQKPTLSKVSATSKPACAQPNVAPSLSNVQQQSAPVKPKCGSGQSIASPLAKNQFYNMLNEKNVFFNQSFNNSFGSVIQQPTLSQSSSVKTQYASQISLAKTQSVVSSNASQQPTSVSVAKSTCGSTQDINLARNQSFSSGFGSSNTNAVQRPPSLIKTQSTASQNQNFGNALPLVISQPTNSCLSKN